MVSFRQFTDRLDVRCPPVLTALRSLDVGHSPAGGWSTFLRGAVTA